MEMAVDFQDKATFSVFKRSETLFYWYFECWWLTLVQAL